MVRNVAQSLPADAFKRFFNELMRGVSDLVNSRQNDDRAAGVCAIHELIDVRLREDESKFIRFAGSLQAVFASPTCDEATIRQASSAFGKLARAGSGLKAEIVNFELQRSLERMVPETKHTTWRLAAMLVLRETAINAPTFFNQKIDEFFANYWTSQSDESISVRIAAAEALREGLRVLQLRRSDQLRSYSRDAYRSLEEALKGGEGGSQSTARLHGAMLCLRELLAGSRTVMAARYNEACEMVLKYRESNDPVVSSAVVALVPQLAEFSPRQFAARHIKRAITLLLQKMKTESLTQGSAAAIEAQHDRATAFLALGRLALATRFETSAVAFVRARLPDAVLLLREALTHNPQQGLFFCPPALTTVAMLARAIGPALTPRVHLLLDAMFGAGLTHRLLAALAELAVCVPAALPLLQERLLHEISLVLAGEPFKQPPAEPAVVLPTAVPLTRPIEAAGSAVPSTWAL